MWNTRKKEIQQLLLMMMPILAAQLSTVGMSLINTLMAGRAGSVDLAGVSVGAGLFYPLLAAVIGVLMAGTPIIAQLLGEKKPEKIPSVVRTGLYMAVLLATLIGGAYLGVIDSLMTAMDLEPEVGYIAKNYLLCMVGTLFFVGLIIPLRALTDTVIGPAVSMKLFLVALPLNGFLNYLLVFGHFGLPRLGGIGSGIAMMTTYAVIFTLFIAFVATEKSLLGREIVSSWKTNVAEWKEYVTIGIPCGLSVFAEMGLFGVIVFLMARFGTETLAAFQVADSFANMIYMIPLSCGMALTILVAGEVGKKNYAQAQRYRTAGIGISVACAMVTIVVTGAFHDMISAFYTEDPAVIRTAGRFLLFAAGWQFFDAFAVPAQGALRGYKDTRIPFLYILFAYWAVCMPIGLILDYGMSMGADAYWLGIDFGVGCAAVLILHRLFVVESHYEVETDVPRFVTPAGERQAYGEALATYAPSCGWNRAAKPRLVHVLQQRFDWHKYILVSESDVDIFVENRTVLEICWSILTDLHLSTVGRASRAYVP